MAINLYHIYMFIFLQTLDLQKHPFIDCQNRVNLNSKAITFFEVNSEVTEILIDNAYSAALFKKVTLSQMLLIRQWMGVNSVDMKEIRVAEEDTEDRKVVGEDYIVVRLDRGTGY